MPVEFPNYDEGKRRIEGLGRGYSIDGQSVYAGLYPSPVGTLSAKGLFVTSVSLDPEVGAEIERAIKGATDNVGKYPSRSPPVGTSI